MKEMKLLLVIASELLCVGRSGITPIKQETLWDENPFRIASGDGWYDGFGLGKADKCEGQFGSTYETANGAKANLRLGQRAYLIQQNWANDGEGRCRMNQFE